MLFTAVHIIPRCSHVYPFYLSAQKALDARRAGLQTKSVEANAISAREADPVAKEYLHVQQINSDLLSNRVSAIRLSEPFPNSGSAHPLRMAFEADTLPRSLQLLIPAPALHARLS